MSISFKPSLFGGFCCLQQNETLTSPWVLDPPHTFKCSRIKNEIGDVRLKSGKCFREGRERVPCTPQGLSPRILPGAARCGCHHLHVMNETQLGEPGGCCAPPGPLPAEALRLPQGVLPLSGSLSRTRLQLSHFAQGHHPSLGATCIGRTFVSVGVSLAQFLDNSEDHLSSRATTAESDPLPTPTLTHSWTAADRSSANVPHAPSNREVK